MDLDESRETPPADKSLPENCGQYRTMRQSMRGDFGILGNVESVTYRVIKGVSGSNPTLTATIKSVLPAQPGGRELQLELDGLKA